MTLAKCQILKRRKMRENASILTTSQVENKKGTRRLSQIDTSFLKTSLVNFTLLKGQICLIFV